MVSPRKSASTISEESRWDNNMASLPAKSCESLYSASSRESARQIYQRKPASRTTNGAMRQATMVPNNTTSDIHQRVMSARNLRAKTFQNQLADAQAEIANLAHENRMLRTMHKRQSMALNKYENTGAELPQLLHSHAEELRVWQTKYRNVQAVNKDLEQKLKQKEAQILSLSDQNKHFSQLIKDKNLDERQKLQDKLRQLEQRLQDKDNDMKLMARKVQLESKNFRQQLLNEQKKSKEVMLKLEKARLEISGYRKLEEFTVDKTNPLASGRRTKLGAVDEIDKIDKLEKSLDLLDRAIEKNNQSEFNALTDVLETDSNFDFEKDDADEEDKDNDIQVKDNKPVRAKFTLPPATTQPKPVANNANNITRLSLSQMMNQSKPSPSRKPNPRLRSGGLPAGNVSAVTGSVVRSTAASKRRDAELCSKQATCEASANNKMRTLTKPLEFDYEEDSEHDADDDDVEANFGRGNDDDVDTDEEQNPNEMSLVDYAPYLNTKCELGKMMGMDRDDDEDDDDDDDVESPEGTAKVALGNSRGPNMKENMSGIRKIISNDYKERENFLDIHCRPNSGSNIRTDDSAKNKKKNSSIATGGAPAAAIGGGQMVASRKHALLAALKVIDDNKDES
ncbi:GH17057 [Drosophila grimshawi]|uniref:GH17057 n=1 Tax=Drosophila grimshawi TaxID=7222 RepID=B4IZK9_DROGR|nr:GH17057 [Drosophila grimshawi]